MAWKSILIVFIGMCLFVSSCYPELSVQQYDKLKEDLEKLDEERTELVQEVAALSTEVTSLSMELEEIKTKNTEVRAYIDFLVQLVSTQNTESLLEGEFDTNALVESKDNLLESAENLKDSEIEYYLSLINPENEAETVGVYYKAIEECLKAIVALAELQRGFELLAAEINRTKRITNALEYVVIPGLQATISYLNMKFEERDREEKARLKRVKVLVARE